MNGNTSMVFLGISVILFYLAYYGAMFMDPQFGGKKLKNIEWEVGLVIVACILFPPVGIPILLLFPLVDAVMGSWQRVLTILVVCVIAAFALALVNENLLRRY